VQNFRKLHVRGLPSQLPEHLELDVTELEINDTIRVSELKFEGLTVIERPTDVVVAVRHQRKEEEVVVAAATVEGAVAAPAAGAAVPGAAGAPAPGAHLALHQRPPPPARPRNRNPRNSPTSLDRSDSGG
jgi:large subunit ribosomal protein L25